MKRLCLLCLTAVFFVSAKGFPPLHNNTVRFFDNLFIFTLSADPTAGAPAPKQPQDEVISLFSDVYKNVNVDTWSAPWDKADVEEIKIAGDNIKKYTNLGYAGIDFGTSPINATAMDLLHIDLWTPATTSVAIKLVDFGSNGVYDGGGDDTESELYFTPALGSWNSFDIPLTDFTKLAGREHLAMLVISAGNGTSFIDNVYFHQKK